MSVVWATSGLGDDSGHHHATCSKAASREWKRGHDHVIEAVADILHTSGMAYTAKESQIPAHVDSRKKGDILVESRRPDWPLTRFNIGLFLDSP